MLNKHIQQSEHSFNLATQLWQDLSQLLDGLDEAPSSLKLKESCWAEVDAFNLPVEVYFYLTDISPDKSRLMFSYIVTDSETFDEITCIAVYRICGTQLSKETEFKFKNLRIDVETDQGSSISNFRQAQFMGNDHIAMALATGHLRILSIPDNTVFLDEKIAGLASTLTCSENHLAVSLFPGLKEKYYFACGVKIYRIKEIIEHKRLDPCHVLHGESFSILPHSLRFHPDDDHILCKGSQILSKGYINYIEEYSVKNEKLVTILKEEDETISQKISNYSDAGEYCVVSKHGLKVNNAEHNTVWHPCLPSCLNEEKIRNCKLSADGSQVILFKNGVLYLAQKNRSETKVFNNLGYVNWAHFISNKSIIVGLFKFYHMEMMILDTNDFSTQATLNQCGPVELINPDGYTFSGKGDVLISDSKGRIRKFDTSLITEKKIIHTYGPVRQFEYDPGPDKNAFLTESGAVIILDTDSDSMHLKIGHRCGTQIKPGSGYHCIHTSETNQTKKDGIWMCSNYDNRSIAFKNERYLEIIRGSTKLEFSDWVNGSFIDPVKSELPDKVMDSCNFNNQALILLKNGTIVRVNPYETPLSTDDLNGITYPALVENIESPLGLIKLTDTQIAVWTKETILLFFIVNDTGHVQTSVKAKGVGQVKWDKQSQRLVVAFNTHLSFYSFDLVEMYRLYLLKDHGHLIHVPFPEKLKHGHHCHHPGYFWSNEECSRLFNVTARDDTSLKDNQMKDDFISNHFNKTMVETALNNHDDFCRIAAGSENQSYGIPNDFLIEYEK